MARTVDPTRLSDQDANEVRSLVNRVRKIGKITHQELAEHLDWDIRKLTNAVAKNRPLLAGTALEMLKGLADHPRVKFGSVEASTLLLNFWHTNTWVDRLYEERRTVAAVIPNAECKRLAEQLAAIVGSVNGVRIGVGKQELIAKALERRLKLIGPKMAKTWYEATATPVSFAVEHTLDGRGDWVGVIFDRMENPSTAQIVRESIYCAAVIGFVGAKK